MARHRPGSYAGHLERFRGLPLEVLEGIAAGLPRYGAGWPRSNYRLALERAISAARIAAARERLDV